MGGGFPCCCGQHLPGEECCGCQDCDAPESVTVTIGNWTPTGGCDISGSWVLPYTQCLGSNNLPTGRTCSGTTLYGLCAGYGNPALNDGTCNWTAALQLCKDSVEFSPDTAKLAIYGGWCVTTACAFIYINFCYLDPSDKDCRDKSSLSATVVSFEGSSTTPTVTIDLP